MCPRVLGSWVEILGRGCVVVEYSLNGKSLLHYRGLRFCDCLFVCFSIASSRAIKSCQLCYIQLLSCVQLFATLWTVAHQTPLSVGSSRQDYWSGLPFPLPGDLPDPGTEPVSFAVTPLNSFSVAVQNHTHLGNERTDPAAPCPAFYSAVSAWR